MDEINFTFNGTLDIDALLGIEKPSNFEIGIKYFCYILSMAIAFVGNLCILVVILRTKSLRTKFNFYILNLALSDMLMPTICMWIHLVVSTQDEWTLGEPLCKAHTFLQVSVVCTSVFTLSVVTLDRFLATVVPSRVWITQKFQPALILLIWAASISIALPWLLYQLYAEIDWIGGHEIICRSMFPSLEARRAYYVSFFTLVFMVPLFLMFVLIVVTVIKDDNSRPSAANQTPNAEMRKRAVYMVLTVVVVLCVCWAPNQSILLWDVYRDRDKMPNGIKDLHYVSIYMAYTSSAINPVIYFIYNKCFRHALYQLLRNKCKGDNSSMAVFPERPRPASVEPSTQVIDMTSLNEEATSAVRHDNLFTTDCGSASQQACVSAMCHDCIVHQSSTSTSAPECAQRYSPMSSLSGNITKISESD